MVRQAPAAPEPQGIDRQFAGRGALRIERMVVQDHLGFVQQTTPALAVPTLGQVREQVIAQHFPRRRKVGQMRVGRQAQVPARRMRCGNRKALIAEQRLQRFQQRLAFVQREAKIATGPHPHRCHVRPQMARIGTQPGEVHRISGIQLTGQRGHRQAARQDVEAARDACRIAGRDLFEVRPGGDTMQHAAG